MSPASGVCLVGYKIGVVAGRVFIMSPKCAGLSVRVCVCVCARMGLEHFSLEGTNRIMMKYVDMG